MKTHSKNFQFFENLLNFNKTIKNFKNFGNLIKIIQKILKINQNIKLKIVLNFNKI